MNRLTVIIDGVGIYGLNILKHNTDTFYLKAKMRWNKVTKYNIYYPKNIKIYLCFSDLMWNILCNDHTYYHFNAGELEV